MPLKYIAMSSERGHEDRDRILALGAAEVGILGAEDLLREPQHPRLVRLRHAEDAHDHVQRIVERDVAREVALAAELEHAVDEAPREHRQTSRPISFRRFAGLNQSFVTCR